MRVVFRSLFAIAVVVVLALAILHVANYRRIDAGGLSDGIDSLIERTRDLQTLARPEYQDHALAGFAGEQQERGLLSVRRPPG